jgi:N-acetylglucosaminyldiphosphoundecaprenol N-acetyl-beta-D-mannosaminyltransferase
MISKKNILGVGITNASRGEILEYIVKNLENFKEKHYFVTPNPEFLVLAGKNVAFKNILNNADLALADGVGVMIAAKILGKPLKDRFTGVDLVKSVCEVVSEKPITVGFLGGRDGVAELTAECLQKKYPKLKIAFVGEEWDIGSTHPLNESLEPKGNTFSILKNRSLSPADKICKSASRDPLKSSFRGGSHLGQKGSSENGLSRANYLSYAICHKPIDILFVAFGAPKQEFWISENLEKLPVKIAVGVGGAFDYISGKITRAPNFVRSIGFEWLFRLVVQPWRIKRQFSLIKFIYLVIKEKIN